MKTKFIICVLLLVTCHLSLVTLSSAAELMKIGYIDLQRIVYESEAGKKAKSELDALIKSKQAVVDEKRKTLEKLKSDLEKQASRSEEHTSELQSRLHLVCRLLLEKKKIKKCDLDHILRYTLILLQR